MRNEAVTSTLKFVDTFPMHENAAVVLGAAVDDLFRRVISRAPTNSERRNTLRHLESSSRDRDWAGFAQVLLCSNAFLYRD